MGQKIKTSAGYKSYQWVMIIVSVALMFLTKFIPAPEGLSQSGFQLLGIVCGAMILWVGLSTTWPNLLVMMALTSLPELGAAAVARGSFGNDTVVYLIFCMMLAASITKTGIAKRLAIYFLTNRLSRRSPWWTVVMFCVASFIICSFVSSVAGIVIVLPIAIECLERVKCGKKSPAATLLILATVVFCVLANCATPIAHAMSLQGMSLYQSYTGEELEFFTFCATLIPVAVACGLIFFLMCRFVWRPDISCMKSLDYDELRASIGPMGRREKIAAVVYIIVAILWIIPGVSNYIFPGIYPYLSWIDKNYPPIAAVLILNFITVDNEPVLAYQDSFANISWGTITFVAVINLLGSATANADIGLPAWLASTLTPVFSGVNPLVFIFIIVLFCAVFTNFASNAVAVSLGYAIAMPLVLTIYQGSISPVMMGLFITCSSQFSYATAPSTPAAAVAIESGWVNSTSVFKWGMLASVIFCAVLVALGSVTCNLFS